MSSYASDRFQTLVASVGGLTLQPDDIKTLADNHIGNLLLNWLANQVSHEDSAKFAAEVGQGDLGQSNAGLPSSLLEVALEDDETTILQYVRSLNMEQPQSSEMYKDYRQPSRLSRHAQYVDEERNLVKQEAEIIRGRILRTQKVSKKLSQTIKSIRRALIGLETNVRVTEERLSESSINADTIIGMNVDKAQKILQDLGHSSREVEFAVDGSTENEGNDLDAVRSILSGAQGKLSMITISLTEDLHNFSVLREQENVKVEELEADLNFLQHAFDALTPLKENLGTAKAELPCSEQEAVTQQLEEICLLLENEVSSREGGVISSNGEIEVLLSEIDKKPGKKLPEEERFSVKRIVYNSWTSDQAEILQLQQDILDQAIDRMRIEIAPLEKLHESLTSLIRITQDVEALLEALGEELQEICIDVPVISGNIASLHDDTTFQHLKLLLTELKDLRLNTAAPLALITHADILAEVRAVKAHYDALERAEKSLVDEIMQKYSPRPLDSRLTDVYKNSKMNNSPPFSFASDVCKLEQKTAIKTTELQKLADSLETDVREFFVKDSQLKRFNAFIEKS